MHDRDGGVHGSAPLDAAVRALRPHGQADRTKGAPKAQRKAVQLSPIRASVPTLRRSSPRRTNSNTPPGITPGPSAVTVHPPRCTSCGYTWLHRQLASRCRSAPDSANGAKRSCPGEWFSAQPAFPHNSVLLWPEARRSKAVARGGPSHGRPRGLPTTGPQRREWQERVVSSSSHAVVTVTGRTYPRPASACRPDRR